MKEYGFKINECDKCVWIKNTKNDYAILSFYVDDISLEIMIK